MIMTFIDVWWNAKLNKNKKQNDSLLNNLFDSFRNIFKMHSCWMLYCRDRVHLAISRILTTTLVMIGTVCTGSCKSDNKNIDIKCCAHDAFLQ